MNRADAPFPRLHNAMWPGLVGKGDGAEPAISLDQMLTLTAQVNVDGARFDGVDLFLAEPHFSIDSNRAAVLALADKIGSLDLSVGSCVAPIWPDAGGGSAIGTLAERSAYLIAIRKACEITAILNETGLRTYGVIRIDTACSPADWAAAPEQARDTLIDTLTKAADIAEQYDERLALEGEICWGGIHSWRDALDVLQAVNRPDRIGFQADMAHTMLYAMGYNAPEYRLLRSENPPYDRADLDEALRQISDALRPWVIDFHVAQNDGSTNGSGSHDKTGRHCMPDDANGLLDIPQHAGLWLRDDAGQLTKSVSHICWDGCMFSNETLENPKTWESVLCAMLSVRAAHGWE